MSSPSPFSSTFLARWPSLALSDLHDPAALIARVSKRLRDANKRLAFAESCTGGLLSSWLTDLPGASTFFEGGVVSYSDLAKQRLLGVRAETLERWGAVSEACAREMAEGARERFDADLAVAITGIAGPGGGSREKPVGTVTLCLYNGAFFTVEDCRFPGDRSEVRTWSALTALALLEKDLDEGNRSPAPRT
jgi:PncC family amidohydrolase